MTNTQYGLICLALAVGSAVACIVAFAGESQPQQDTRHYPHTVQQLEIMSYGQADIGPSPSYWSAREMPLYIQNGCTEDVLHTKQNCPF